MQSQSLHIEDFFGNVGVFGLLFHKDKPLWNSLDSIKAFLSGMQLDARGNFISSSAWLHPTASVEHSFIGEGTRVYEFVTIRESIIGAYTTIGHCTEVARSVVMSKCSVPRFNYVGSSILGNNVRLGGCCSLASRRFDDSNVVIVGLGESLETNRFKFGSIVGDNCLLGFSVHCNPGTLIGMNSIVMPHVELRGIIPANSIVSVQQRVVISRKRDVSNVGLHNLDRPKGDK